MCAWDTDRLNEEGLRLLRHAADLKPCGDATVCRHDLRALLRERDELRAIVAEVADDATVNSVRCEESSNLHLECSDCQGTSKTMYGPVDHDETCIVSRARAAIAKVGGGA